jgi:hypothetical protein
MKSICKKACHEEREPESSRFFAVCVENRVF